MKKGTFIIGIFFLILFLSGQEIQEEAIAINIEVPVRVFKGDTFVDNLTIDDFEVYEEGILHKIDAVYLIKKTAIKREESGLKKEDAKKKFAPQPTKRQFILVFDVIDYSKGLGEIIDYFFNNVFSPEDILTIVTPLKTYELKNELFVNIPIEKVTSQLKENLKKDTRIANAEYKSIIRNIITRNATLFEYLRLKNLRRLEEKKLLDFAVALKQIEGQKNVFILYQRDAIPVPNSSWSSIGNSLFPGSSFSTENLGVEITFDVNRVKQAFSDSLISAHFIYITNTENFQQSIENQEPSDLMAEDWSMNVFSAFNEVAKATGGIVDSSANPAFSFEKAAEASENYYLLYYTPKNYVADGKFKKIEVKVKEKKYRVTHRAGYIAD